MQARWDNQEELCCVLQYMKNKNLYRTSSPNGTCFPAEQLALGLAYSNQI